MLSEEPVAGQHSHRTRARTAHVRKGPGEFLRPSRLDELKPHAECPCRDFCCRQHVFVRAFAERTWQPEDSDPIDSRNSPLEQFQALADQLGSKARQPSDIAARPREARDEPALDGIANTSEDDGDRFGGLHGRQGDACASCHENDIDLEQNQFGCKSGGALDPPLGVSIFNDNVAALDVTEIAQP